MKRFFTLFVGLMILLAGTAFAEESVLIDFSELTPNWPADDPRENEETLIDVSDEAAGTLYTEEELQQMRTSLAIENWEVELNSSSRFAETQRLSEIRRAPVNQDANRFEGEDVLGVRVNFPNEPYNGWAMIRPPFEIPAYADPTEVDADGNVERSDEGERGTKFDNRGVVKNIGTLRSLALNAYGLNFPHGVSVVLQDQNNEQEEIFLGYLDFEGWRTMVWDNPNYLDQVRDRELRTFPLYPNLQPMRKLIGIRIYRDGSMEGGDFITY
ncbi:MAG: flagellar filament outer layer protein FlaA, partial [Spirochaetota bacterium]